jgi:hypothetical protein
MLGHRMIYLQRQNQAFVGLVINWTAYIIRQTQRAPVANTESTRRKSTAYHYRGAILDEAFAPLLARQHIVRVEEQTTSNKVPSEGEAAQRRPSTEKIVVRDRVQAGHPFLPLDALVATALAEDRVVGVNLVEA